MTRSSGGANQSDVFAEIKGLVNDMSAKLGGVIAMIDTLIKELDTEMTEAETNEKINQEDYEEMMADSAAKRAADSKSLAQREGAKADNLSNVEETLTDEIKALAAGIVALDKSVAEETEQRKKENPWPSS